MSLVGSDYGLTKRKYAILSLVAETNVQFTDKQLRNFFKKIQKTGSCWLWFGCKINGGYGRFKLNDKWLLAHRVSYLIHKGSIPKSKEYHGTIVMHTCDVRNCVNPEHLILGTQKDNMHDAKIKNRKWNGRFLGSRNPNWKGGISIKRKKSYAV